jgi:probable addiction module antidote protein
MTQTEKVIKPKLGLLELAKQLGNVSHACKIMGYSRDSFYRFKELYDTGGELALQELSKRRPNPKNRIAEDVEQAVVELALAQPAWGQVRVSNELKKRAEMLADGDARAVPVALRTVAEALGGMGALAQKTGLSRETLYRTLSERGNPRLDTLAAILAAFGLRLSVQPTRKARSRLGTRALRTPSQPSAATLRARFPEYGVNQRRRENGTN